MRGSLVLFAFSPWLGISAAALFGVGFSQQAYLTLNNSVVQETVDDEPATFTPSSLRVPST